MEETRLSIRIDKALKEQAGEVFTDIGMNLTTAVTVFLRQSVRDNGLPFRPALENPLNIQARKEVEEGDLEYFDDVNDLLKSLHA